MSKNIVHLMAAATIAAAMSLSGPAPVAAFDQGDVNYINHYVQCKIWLLQGSKKHKRFCLPSHVVVEFHSLSYPNEDFGLTGKKKKRKHHHHHSGGGCSTSSYARSYGCSGGGGG